jgi:thiol-disulfide isomerase/thioredoxin
MNTYLLNKIALTALFVGLLATAHAALKVGDAMPDLATFNLEGKLPEVIKGKVVIIDFWASWCGPCKDSFPAMDELQKKYGDQGLVIIAINEDEEKSDMQDFLKANPATFSIVRDTKQKLVNVAGIKTMPSSFVFDSSGVLRFAHNGFHGAQTRKEYEQQIESLRKK